MNPNSYNIISPFYDVLAKFVYFNNIYRSQLENISKIPNNASVLFIGGGSGKILNSILKGKPQIRITYIDRSEKMLNKAKNNCNYSNQVEFVLGSEGSIPSKEFDSIITFFFLDLFEPKAQKQVHCLLKEHLKINGQWLVADFNPANNWWQKILEYGMFLFLKWSTNIEAKRINNINSLFDPASFKEETRAFYYGNYIFSTLYRKL